MQRENRLDLDRGNVLATAPNQILPAVDEPEATVAVASDQVASMKPAAAPRFSRRLRILEILPEEPVPWIGSRAADEQLAGDTRVDFPAGLVDDPALHLRLGNPETRGTDRPRFMVCYDYRPSAGLGHGPRLNKRQAETPFKRFVVARADARTEP